MENTNEEEKKVEGEQGVETSAETTTQSGTEGVGTASEDAGENEE
jgi:hypothetical protein